MIVQGKEVCNWVAEKANIYINQDCQGIGYLSNGKLIAGVSYERYTGKSIMVHQRVDSSVPKGFWFAVVDYPFSDLGVKHLIGLVDSTNQKAIKINLKMGFKVEATIADAGSDGGDLLIMKMSKDNCKLLGWGKK